MLVRSITTAAVAVALLVVGLFAPVAGAQVDVVAEVSSTVVEGLPATGARAYASTATAVESAPRAMPMPFSLVGFAVPDGAAVDFRTSTDGETWTEWTHAHVNPDEGPDRGSPEAAAAGGSARSADGVPRDMSDPTWVGEAAWLQVKVLGASPEQIGVHLVDSLGQSRSLAQRVIDSVQASWRSAPQPAAAEVPQPSIRSRAEWDADESWRKGRVRTAARATVGFVHHTATTDNAYPQSEAAALVRGIYWYHTHHNGWDDIGYNFLIDRFGTVYEGRFGGIEKAVIGAHAGGFNTGTYGVAILGDFTDTEPSSPARDALARLMAWKFDVHHADSAATVTMESGGSTLYPEGHEVELEAVSGHRDVSATACPGNSAYPLLGSIREAVQDHAVDMLVDPSASPSTVQLTAKGPEEDEVRFRARMQPSGSWTLQVRDPDGTILHAHAGTGSTVSSTWQLGNLEPGLHRWSISSPGRRTATGTVSVVHDVLERVGTASDAVRAAVQLSQEAFPDDGGAEHAVVVRNDVFADALAGGPLAATTGPLLLTGSDSLDDRVREELERVLPEGRTVYVLGGEKALASSVAEALARTWEVRRLEGDERTATAAAVAEVVLKRGSDGLLGGGGKTAMLARAYPDAEQPWADALAGGAYGAAHGIPVLLTHTDVLGKETRRVLEGLSSTIILGGTSAVSAEVEEEVPNSRRVAGPERTATAAAIAEELWGRTKAADGDMFIIAGGHRDGAWTLPLAASPLAALHGAPVLLTAGTTLSQGTRSYLDGLGYSDSRQGGGWVLGGTGAVDDAVAAEVSGLLQ